MKTFKERLNTSLRNPYIVLVLTAVVASLLFYGTYSLASSRSSSDAVDGSLSPSPVPAETPGADPSATPSGAPAVTPEPSASPSMSSPSPSPSPSSNPSVTLPSAAQQTVASFFSAYKDRDSAALEKFFTSDDLTELKSLRARLFTGTDTDGIPGGPTLFSTNAAGEYAESYSSLTVEGGGAEFVLTLREDRKGTIEDNSRQITTVMSIVQVDGTWKISSYSHQGNSGKYNAFMAY